MARGKGQGGKNAAGKVKGKEKVKTRKEWKLMNFEASYPVGEDFKISARAAIEEFRYEESKRELAFPASHTKDERAYIHKFAQSLGLLTKSRGVHDVDRFITVSKKVEGAVKMVGGSPTVNMTLPSRFEARCLLKRFPVTDTEKRDLQLRNKRHSVKNTRDTPKPSGLNSRSAQVPDRRSRSHLEEFRKTLPVYDMQDEIMTAIAANRVILLCGETGSGKTTQVPQFILDECHLAGRPCRIICTQPRRLSALSVAERVAAERGESIGQTVGYQIRLESRVSQKTVLTFCTNGVLLRTLMSGEHSLSTITHVIVDEIHERDRFSDFLLIQLRDILRTKPHLKLILMSAALDTELFIRYFNGCPIVNVPGKIFEVEELFLEDILKCTNYKTRKMVEYKNRQADAERSEAHRNHWLKASEKLVTIDHWTNENLESSSSDEEEDDAVQSASSDVEIIEPDNTAATANVDCTILLSSDDEEVIDEEGGIQYVAPCTNSAKEQDGNDGAKVSSQDKNTMECIIERTICATMTAADEPDLMELGSRGICTPAGAEEMDYSAANGTVPSWYIDRNPSSGVNGAAAYSSTSSSDIAINDQDPQSSANVDMAHVDVGLVDQDCHGAGASSLKENAEACDRPPQSDQMDSTLTECWLTGSDDAFAQLLYMVQSENIDVNYAHYKTSITPLAVAVARGRQDVAEKLLSLGADMNARLSNDMRLVDMATRFNQTEMVTFLEAYVAKALSKSVEVTVEVQDVDEISKEDRELVLAYQHSFDDERVDLDLVVALLTYICDNSQEGAVLVFLPGYDDIVKLRERLHNMFDKRFSNGSFKVYTLHSSMQSSDQKKVFQSTRKGTRKIILSTNIAETSVTINDVVFVIDSGKVKEKTFDALAGISMLKSTWISRASAKQRKGRAGRCQPGMCFHMISRTRYKSLLEFQTPEILRVPLQELCLHAKLLAPPDTPIVDYLAKAPDPPPNLVIKNAVSLLKAIDCMDQWEDLTELGHHLADLPVEPRLGKMVLYSIVLKCLDPVLTIVCTLSYKDPFILPNLPSEKKLAQEVRKELASDTFSDHMALLRAFQGWQKARSEGEERSFCEDNFLSRSTLEMIVGMRTQLLSQLRMSGFAQDLRQLNTNSGNWAAVKASLCAGLYPNIIKVNRGNKHLTTPTEKKVRLHPSSVIHQKSSSRWSDRPVDLTTVLSLPTDLLIYEEMTKINDRIASPSVRCATVVTPITVALFAGPVCLPDHAVFTRHNESSSEEEDYDDAGYRVDDEGQRVDKTWYRFDEAGNRVNEAGHRVNEAGHRVNEAGHRIDEEGYRVDEMGHRVEEAGHHVEEVRHPVEKAGHHVEEVGHHVEEAGHHVEEKEEQMEVKELPLKITKKHGRKATLKLDEWLILKANQEIASLTLQLRQKWHTLFLRRMRTPAKPWSQEDEDILTAILKVLRNEEQEVGLYEPEGIGQRPIPVDHYNNHPRSGGGRYNQQRNQQHRPHFNSNRQNNQQGPRHNQPWSSSRPPPQQQQQHYHPPHQSHTRNSPSGGWTSSANKGWSSDNSRDTAYNNTSSRYASERPKFSGRSSPSHMAANFSHGQRGPDRSSHGYKGRGSRSHIGKATEPRHVGRGGTRVQQERVPSEYSRFFILKCSDSQNIDSSYDKGVWCATRGIEDVLSRAYRTCKDLVYLIITLQGSGQFQGYVQMTSDISYPRSTEWRDSSGRPGGEFKVCWIKKANISFHQTRHLMNPWKANQPIRNSIDGQELEPSVGEQLTLLWFRVPTCPAQ